VAEEKVKGPKSYFPSIVAKYGQPIEHWMSILEPHAGLKHMDQVTVLMNSMAWGMVTQTQ